VFAELVRDRATPDMKYTFNLARHSLRYEDDRSDENQLAATRQDRDVSFGVSAYRGLTYGANRYVLSLDVIQPDLPNTRALLTEVLGAEKGCDGRGAPAWIVRNGSVVLDDRKPTFVRFTSGEPLDIVEVASRPKLPVYAVAEHALARNWASGARFVSPEFEGIHVQSYEREPSSDTIVRVNLYHRDDPKRLYAVEAVSIARTFSPVPFVEVFRMLGVSDVSPPLHALAERANALSRGDVICVTYQNYAVRIKVTDSFFPGREVAVWRRNELRGWFPSQTGCAE